MSTERVRIALQKSGRMADDSLNLLRNCGLHVARSKEQLLCRIKELPIDVLLVRDDDIPHFVSSGICDLGIVGENVFAEEKNGTPDFGAVILERLGFSVCRLVVAVPEKGPIQTMADLAGTTIATSYPHLLQVFLREQGITATTLEMTGSVEVAPRLKIVGAICDTVASGATPAANNLRELADDPVQRSPAYPLVAKDLWMKKEAIIHRLRADAWHAAGRRQAHYVARGQREA